MLYADDILLYRPVLLIFRHEATSNIMAFNQAKCKSKNNSATCISHYPIVTLPLKRCQRSWSNHIISKAFAVRLGKYWAFLIATFQLMHFLYIRKTRSHVNWSFLLTQRFAQTNSYYFSFIFNYICGACMPCCKSMTVSSKRNWEELHHTRLHCM